MAETVTHNFDRNAILKSVVSTPPSDWEGFFEFLRYQQYKKLSSCTSEEQRIEIQQSVKGITHIESVFKWMHANKKFPA